MLPFCFFAARLMLASPKNCQWFHIENHLKTSSSGTHPSFPIEKMTVIWLLHPEVHDLPPMWGPARSRPQSCHAPGFCRMQRRKIFRNLRLWRKSRKKSTNISSQNQPVGISNFQKIAQTNKHFEQSKPSRYCWRAPPLQHSQPVINKFSWVSPPRGRLHVVPSSRHHTSICVGSPSSSEMICLVNLMNLRKKKSQFVHKLFQWMQNAFFKPWKSQSKRSVKTLWSEIRKDGCCNSHVDR